MITSLLCHMPRTAPPTVNNILEVQAITPASFVTACDVAASVICVAVVSFDQPHKPGPVKQ